MLIELYKKMFLIRKFEEKVLDLFSEGKLFGTTHAYISVDGKKVIRIGMNENPIPASTLLEAKTLPSLGNVLEKINSKIEIL